MSATHWGEMAADPAFRDIDAGPTAPAQRDRETDETQTALSFDSLAESAFTLRGTGSRPASCGSWYPLDFCEQCGEPHFRQSHCENRDCPDCWTGNVARTAESVTARFCGARHHQDSYEDKRAVHTVVSPPDGEIRTVPEVYAGFREAYDLAQEHGIRGGVAIFHGYRPTAATKREFRAVKRNLDLIEDSDLAIWQWIRQRTKSWRAQVEWSPHYHIVGLARDVAPADTEADDGWLVWRIRSLESYRMSAAVDGTDAFSDTAGLVRYLLSHSTHEAGESKSVVRWFGECATANFSMDDLALSSKRMIEDKAHQAVYGESIDADDDEPATCEEPECSGDLMPIWDAYLALQDREWCDQVGREQQRKLEAAADWMMGDLGPPPGLKYPDSADAAREVIEVIQR